MKYFLKYSPFKYFLFKKYLKPWAHRYQNFAEILSTNLIYLLIFLTALG